MEDDAGRTQRHLGDFATFSIVRHAHRHIFLRHANEPETRSQRTGMVLH